MHKQTGKQGGKQGGFTLIELLLGLAALAVSIAIFMEVLFITRTPTEQNQYPLHCISGYTYIVQADGKAQQVLNENGGGITCKLQ